MRPPGRSGHSAIDNQGTQEQGVAARERRRRPTEGGKGDRVLDKSFTKKKKKKKNTRYMFHLLAKLSSIFHLQSNII